jgi:hypothetical protein
MNMSTFFRASGARTYLIVLTALSALAGCDREASNGAGAVTDSNVTEKIEQASTPADHRELAEYYEARANTVRREGAEERELRGQYERRWRSDNHPMGSRAGRHFEELAEGHEQTASHYREMADWHREMAQRGEHASTPDE